MQRALANLGITPKAAARLQMSRPSDRLPENSRPEPPKFADQKPEPPKPTDQKTESLKLSDLKPEPKSEEPTRTGLRPESDLLDIKVTNGTGLKKVNSHKQLVEPPKPKVTYPSFIMNTFSLINFLQPEDDKPVTPKEAHLKRVVPVRTQLFLLSLACHLTICSGKRERKGEGKERIQATIGSRMVYGQVQEARARRRACTTHYPSFSFPCSLSFRHYSCYYHTTNQHHTQNTHPRLAYWYFRKCSRFSLEATYK